MWRDPLDDLQEDLVHPASEGDLLGALESLRRQSMIETGGIALFTLQPVVMEYVTDRIVDQIYKEIGTEAMEMFGNYALIKAQTKDYVRESQVRLILKPVAERLLSTLWKEQIEQKLKSLLLTLRNTLSHQPGYVAGNTLNLLIQLQSDLRGYDFSQLKVRQAYLPGVALRDVNFRHTTFVRSVFTETFGSILSVSFSPNGKLLAAGTDDGEIRLWQVPEGTPLLTCQAHTDWVRSIAFSPDGKTIASGNNDYTVRLWEVGSGQCLKTLHGHNEWVMSVAFSPDGKTIASGGEDQAIRLWKVSSGQCLTALHGHTGWVWSVAFSSDGKTIASSSEDGTIKLWDVQTGNCLKTFSSERPYERMNITGVRGLTEVQKVTLKV